jgi:hypothetical protein
MILITGATDPARGTGNQDHHSFLLCLGDVEGLLYRNACIVAQAPGRVVSAPRALLTLP